MTDSNERVTDDLGTSRPHTARVYDYFLGGKTNYGPDRQAAAQALMAYPNAMTAVRHNRSFMHRVIRHLAQARGLRQFLDVGTGLPTEPNLHQVAQACIPDARVVYTDNDPLVLTYARGLLTSTPEGMTEYVHADLREPRKILTQARNTLDFDQPIGLSLIAVAHFVREDPYAVVRELVAALAPGSAVALSHATADLDPEGMRKIVEVYEQQGMEAHLRTKDEVGRFFDGLEMVEPGIVATCDWRPDLEAEGLRQLPGMVSPSEVGVWAGLGIKTCSADVTGIRTGRSRA